MRDARIAELERRLAELEAVARDLVARLNQNASNSSMPPSQNPPLAPPPVVKKKSKRKRGAQPGHPPHLKKLLPPERVARVERFVPTHCEQCQAALPAEAGADDPAPSRHQVADLPEIRATVVEYQGHTRTCSCCGHATHAPIPAAIRAHSIGPGLAAALNYFAGCHHVSQRGLEDVAETLFEVPVSLGKVANLQKEMSQALQPAHEEVMAAVREASVKNVDETSWKLSGKLCWLWVAATKTVALFVIHRSRGVEGLIALLGNWVGGVIGSDRWSAYGQLDIRQRQLCWAHLKRDFQKIVDRGGAGVWLGKVGLRTVKRVFEVWHLYRGGGLTRMAMTQKLEKPARELEAALRAGQTCVDTKVARFCSNLLALEPGLWRFVYSEGIEPTNNHAERVLRKGVLWRKNAFGSGSESGCRFVERMLTVTQTLRLQNRPVLSFLRDSLTNHRQALAAPKLVAMG